MAETPVNCYNLHDLKGQEKQLSSYDLTKSSSLQETKGLVCFPLKMAVFQAVFTLLILFHIQIVPAPPFHVYGGKVSPL